MNKKIYLLLIAQFLSAFADNAILFAVIALVMQSATLANWYVPALQSLFLISFIIFAPWVGAWANQFAKKYILLSANSIKALGASLLLLNIEPLVAYALVGLGAALYSPAKYGILPELVIHNLLIKANSWIEGATIVAILLGMLVGAQLADQSIHLALYMTIGLYIFSALISLYLPTINLNKKPPHSKIKQFYRQLCHFFESPQSRFTILGASLFWLTAATLRVILIAWAPLILLSKSATDIAQLTLFLAVGIILGSTIAPKIITLETIQRTKIPAACMAIFIILLSTSTILLTARINLFFIGVAGGIFIVPINAMLQDIGQQTIGSGAAVALQNFFQNIAMLFGVGSYTYLSAKNISPTLALIGLGSFILLSTFVISLHLKQRT